MTLSAVHLMRHGKIEYYKKDIIRQMDDKPIYDLAALLEEVQDMIEERQAIEGTMP